jgi:hypothetical protein
VRKRRSKEEEVRGRRGVSKRNKGGGRGVARNRRRRKRRSK